MGFTIFLAGPPKDAEKKIDKICADLERSAGPYVSSVKCREEDRGTEVAVFAIAVEIRDVDGENAEEFQQSLARRLIVEGLARGFIPLDAEGRVIYIFPEYGFDVAVFSKTAGRHMLLNDIVNSVCSECDNFDGSRISRVDIGEKEGELFIVHIRFQDYRSSAARDRFRLACFFRLMGKLVAADFIALDLSEGS